MILFLANTITQLMNAVIICKMQYKDEKCDIYFTNNLKEYIKRAKKEDVFDSCYEIELPKDIVSRSNRINRAVVRLKNAFDIKKIKRNLPSSPYNYERVFLSGQSLRNIEFYYSIKSLNKDVSLTLYEEGAFEYCLLSMKKNFPQIAFSKVFFHRYYLFDCDEAYVYSPELIDNKWPNIKIKKIPAFKQNVHLIRILNNIFLYQKTELDGKTKKIVILDQAFFDHERDAKQIELVEKIISEVGSLNIYIKMHPRSKKGKYKISEDNIINGTPMEMMMLNEKITDNAFVSITSSATTNFKVVFNEEPVIIMLYNLFPTNNGVSMENEKFIQKVQDSYVSSNFYIPKTSEDFFDIVKKYCIRENVSEREFE